MDQEDSINYEMEEEPESYPYDESQDSSEQQTQSTQQASQSQPPAVPTIDSHLWGFLQPCTTALTRIDFWKIHPRYTIGRNTEVNQVVLPGFKVSNQHCVITWDGNDRTNSCVWVEDKSSNGTFINSEKIGKGQTRLLREGNEIAFGTCLQQTANNGLEDYRFVYRHTAGGMPSEGLYAHYDLGTELGKGSFATVRKAVHRSTGTWFAVKMINASKSVGQQASRNSTLAREISIMEKLKHRNVCKLFEVFFQEDNSINLVLELIEGGDLLEHILKTGGLAEVDARDITYQICDALSYIHSRGVTHRDLKPENVLLTKDKPPVVKVADFGLAKVVDSLTMLRTMCGTPSYLAPEVVKQTNQEGYDNLVDSWSVGVIVFSMIANSSPFVEDENQDIRARILQRQVDWNSLLHCPMGVSPEAVQFIRALLEEDPRRRMSLTDALQHPWLKNHVPFHEPEVEGGADQAMAANGVADDELEEELTPTTQAGPSSQGARPLQRRSDVLSQAAEAGNVLPEPSWEMIAYASARDGKTATAAANAAAAAAAANAANAAKGPNKRVHAQLSILPEEPLDDADMNAPAEASSSAQRGKSSGEETPADENSDRRRSTRRSKVPRRS